MRALVLGFFFVSGMCGLLYEVVWIRTAGTVIGVTTHAIGTVVGVYMAGLALGAWIGGRWADRRTGGALLRLYGLLEGGVALSAIAVPLLLRGSEPLFRGLWGTVGHVAPVYGTLRVLLVAVILIVPTTLMGATLPVLARFLSTSIADAARQTGLAYAINTFGGVLGTLAAGFWLVPDLGLRATTFVAAGLNVAIAIASTGLARGRAGASAPPSAPEPSPPRLPLAVSALSGMTALAYEVAWTRSLVLTVGATVHAFTLILTAFILGLALGSAIASFLVPRLKDLRRALGAVQLLVGVVAIVLLPFLGDLPARFLPRGEYGALLAAQFAVISLFVLVPATLLGAVFPIAIRLAARSDAAVGRSVGAVYTWNTAGSIAGTVLASFALIPAVGLSATIKIAATVNLVVAAWLFRKRLAAIPAAAIVAAWLLPAWNPKVMASGAFLYGRVNVRSAGKQKVDLKTFLDQDTEIVARYWDAYGLVTVHRGRDGVLTMRVNGKADASTGPSDRIDMHFVGHLPLLHHPEPKRALLIGLGGGLTLGAMERHPSLERIDCVEISRAVLRGAEHFRESAGFTLEPPRVNLIVGDGRNAILFGRDAYDVIVSQPSHLWISGMATLFTRDFFHESSLRLAAGGIFCQWVHAKWLSADNFRQVVATFFHAFPHGSLWEVFPGSDYVLLGSRDPLRVRASDLGDRIAKTRALVEYVGADRAAGLLGHLVLDAQAARRETAGSAIITDDRCAIEYTAPRSLGRETRADFLDWLDGARDNAVERTLYEDAGGKATRARRARRSLARAVALHSQGGHQEAFRTIASVREDLFLDARTLFFIDLMSEDALDFAAGRLDARDPVPAIKVLSLIPPESRHFETAKRVLEMIGQRGPR